MAFRSSGPVMLQLPAFRGVARQIILCVAVAYFALAILGLVSADAYNTVVDLLAFHAAGWWRTPWQLVTYPLVNNALLNTLFACMTVWFMGSAIEDERGSRWFRDFTLVSIVGGALLTMLALALTVRILFESWMLTRMTAAGLWPFSVAVVIIYGQMFAESPVRFNFIFTMKAKYLAALYVLIYLALAIAGHDLFGTALTLMTALAGTLYLRLGPRRGVLRSASEQYYGLRNWWYRRKRQSAVKKFQVYMREQGKDVSLDEEGRYEHPDGRKRDMTDRKWMN